MKKWVNITTVVIFVIILLWYFLQNILPQFLKAKEAI